MNKIMTERKCHKCLKTVNEKLNYVKGKMICKGCYLKELKEERKDERQNKKTF